MRMLDTAGASSPAARSTPRYLGIRMRTSCPRPASARGSAPATSASPPVLAKGSTSEAMNRMRSRRAMVVLLHFFENRKDEGGDVRGDALEVGEHVEVDLRGLERLGEPPSEPHEVRVAQLALALAHHRALVQHLLGQAPVVGREARDGPLEVLRDQRVELDQLRLPRLRETPALVELLPGQLHEVLVDDVSDVLEVADEGDERDLLLGEVRTHGLTAQPREEQLDLALEVVELVVAPLDVLEQLLVVAAQDDHRVAQHALGDVAHPEGLASGLADGQPRLVEVAI